MEFNAIQILLVGVWAFIVGIDQFNLLESLWQPIVTGAVVGVERSVRQAFLAPAPFPHHERFS